MEHELHSDARRLPLAASRHGGRHAVALSLTGHAPYVSRTAEQLTHARFIGSTSSSLPGASKHPELDRGRSSSIGSTTQHH